MKKVAIFVEGKTEQEFVVKFLTEWFSSYGIHIDLGNRVKGKVTVQTTSSVPANLRSYVLVVDCQNDDQVMTQIIDQYPSLLSAGYTDVIGLRDLYPRDILEYADLLAALTKVMPKGSLRSQIHIAVMEVEAWFIAETSHFLKISPKLTISRIKAGGFNVDQPCEIWPHPAETLHQIYRLENLAYKKRGNHIKRTLNALSLTALDSSVAPRVPALKGFFDAVDAAVT